MQKSAGAGCTGWCYLHCRPEALHTHRSSTSDTAHVMPDKPDDKETLVDIKPFHVLLVGSGILGSGLLLSASVSYKQAGKQLAAEGIDASIRRKVLPHAVKALAGSLLLTGLAAAGGFYALQSFGFVNSEAPTSMSAFGRAWEMVGRPLPPQQQQPQPQPQQQQQGPVRPP